MKPRARASLPRCEWQRQTPAAAQVHLRFVGGPRIVQRRARNDTCAAVRRLAAFDAACYGAVSADGLRGAGVESGPFVGASGAPRPDPPRKGGDAALHMAP